MTSSALVPPCAWVIRVSCSAKVPDSVSRAPEVASAERLGRAVAVGVAGGREYGAESLWERVEEVAMAYYWNFKHAAISFLTSRLKSPKDPYTTLHTHNWIVRLVQRMRDVSWLLSNDEVRLKLCSNKFVNPPVTSTLYISWIE